MTPKIKFHIYVQMLSLIVAERCESEAAAGDAGGADRRRVPLLPRPVSHERSGRNQSQTQQ